MADVNLKEMLPEALRSDPSLQDFKDVGSLADAFVKTKALVGSSIRIPSADAGDDAKKEFIKKLIEKVPEVTYIPGDPQEREKVEGLLWGKLGRPEKVEGYTLEAGVVEEGVTVDEGALRAAALEMGLTTKQYQKLAKITATERAAFAKGLREGEAALRKEWGQAFDDKVAQARAAALKLGVPATEIERLPPAQLKVWANVAARVGGEPSQVAGQGASGVTGKLTPAEAKMQIAEIQGNPAYWKSGNNPALHQRLKERMAELQAMVG